MSTLFIVILIVFIVTLLVIGAFWFISVYCNKSYFKIEKEMANSNIVFAVNKNEKIVKYFYHNKLKKIYSITFDEFLSFFSPSNAVKVENWVNNCLKKNSDEDGLLDILINNHIYKKEKFCIFKRTNADYDNKILSFESYPFYFQNKKTKHGYRMHSFSIGEINANLNIRKYSYGFITAYKFCYLRDNTTQTSVDRLLLTQMKEFLLRYNHYQKRIVVDGEDGELFFVDLNIKDHDKALNFTKNIIHQMTCFLEINGLNKFTKIYVGIVKNSRFPDAPNKAIKTAHEMVELAASKNLSIVTYEKMIAQKDSDKFTTEIKTILKLNKINYAFNAIFDVKKEKVTGYFAHCIPTIPGNKTMHEIMSQSNNEEECTELFKTTTKNIISVYKNNAKNLSLNLFLGMRLVDAKDLIAILPRNNPIHFIPIFEEFDIAYHLGEDQSLLQIIDKLREKNIFCALRLKDKNTVLNENIYRLFEYYIVPFNGANLSKRYSTSQLEYRMIVEKLLKYEKPIIVSHADDWSTLELLVRSGIEYISGTAVTPISNELKVPNKKDIVKIHKMQDYE